MTSRTLSISLTLGLLAGCGSSGAGGASGSDASSGGSSASSSGSGSSASGGASSGSGSGSSASSSGSGSTNSGGSSSSSGSSASGGSSSSGSSSGSASGSSGSSGGGDAGIAMSTCTSPVFMTSSETGGQTFGSYYLYNDMWNTSATLGPQTLYACSYSSWYVVSNQTDQAGAVLTYPNVQENFSQTVASFHSISSTFAETSPHVGIYEDAYDIWFNGFASGHTELMIWVDNYGQVPAGSKLATPTLGGRTYDAYRTTDGSYIALVSTATFTSGTVDLLQIFDWIVSQGWLASSATLSQIDFGVEVVATGGAAATFEFTNFSITAN